MCQVSKCTERLFLWAKSPFEALIVTDTYDFSIS